MPPHGLRVEHAGTHLHMVHGFDTAWCQNRDAMTLHKKDSKHGLQHAVQADAVRTNKV